VGGWGVGRLAWWFALYTKLTHSIRSARRSVYSFSNPEVVAQKLGTAKPTQEKTSHDENEEEAKMSLV